MKINIRQSIFETNSSSMHALALQKDFDYNCTQCKEKFSNIIPEYIQLKFNPEGLYYNDDKDVNIIESKIQFIYSNILGRMPTVEYTMSKPTFGYADLTLFLSMLTKLGVKYDIAFESYYKQMGHDVWMFQECPNDLFQFIYDGTEKTLCNFLFGDGSSMDGCETDNSYAEKYIPEMLKKMSNNGKCEVFTSYE